MRVIAVDASAFLELLQRSDGGQYVDRLLAETDGVAPDLIDAEVFNRLVRTEKHGTITAAQMDQRLELLRDAPIDRLASTGLVTAARRFTAALSGYDALYAAAAAVLQCGLVTADGGLAATATEQFGLVVTHLPSR